MEAVVIWSGTNFCGIAAHRIRRGGILGLNVHGAFMYMYISV